MSTFTTTVRSDMDIDFHPEATTAARAAFDAEQAKLVEARTKYETDRLPAKLDPKWLASRERSLSDQKAPMLGGAGRGRAKSPGRSDSVHEEAGRRLRSLASGKRRRFRRLHLPRPGPRRSRESRPCGWARRLADPSMVEKAASAAATNNNFDLTDFRVTAKHGRPVRRRSRWHWYTPRRRSSRRVCRSAAAIDSDKEEVGLGDRPAVRQGPCRCLRDGDRRPVSTAAHC